MSRSKTLNSKGEYKNEILRHYIPRIKWENDHQEKLFILINDGAYVTMNRKFIVRIDAEEVSDPTEKALSRKDEIMGVVNTLSNMGF